MRVFLLIVFCMFFSASTYADDDGILCTKSHAECVYNLNKRRLGLISGSARGTYIKIADDIRNVLDGYRIPGFKNDEGLRITPIVGLGSIKNIEDLLYLRTTDVGLVQADVLLYFKNKHKRDSGKYDKVIKEIKYLTAVYNEEVHVICRRGACGRQLGEVKDIRINIGPKVSGTSMTARIVLLGLGFSEKNFSYHGSEDALERLREKDQKSKTAIDAMVLVGGKPMEIVKGIREEDQLELVEITEIPYDLEIYKPGIFSESDGYESLLGDRASVQTIAVPAVLAVYGGNYQHRTRFLNLRALCHGLVEKQKEFRSRAIKKSVHKKWHNWNPAIEIKFWSRHECMTEALEKAKR